MKRRAVIISNPGEDGAENYCTGVLRDVENYRAFLESPNGGLWYSYEIEEMSRPSVFSVNQKIQALSAFDYVMVIFSGHGEYTDTTMLELRAGQEIDSRALRLHTKRQSIILDCCRKKVPVIITDARLKEVAKAAPLVNPKDCRKYYDKEIEQCAPGPVVLYSCDIDELSGDDSRTGGIYSYNLLKSSQNWANSLDKDTSNSYYTLSLVGAHNRAVPLVQTHRGGSQNPQIEKAREAPYYPFCIVA